MKWYSLLKEPPKENGSYVLVNIKPNKFEAYYPHVMGWTDLGWNTMYDSKGNPYIKSRIFLEEQEEAENIYYCSLKDWNKMISRLIQRGGELE